MPPTPPDTSSIVAGTHQEFQASSKGMMKVRFMMGRSIGCPKCLSGAPGHYSHIVYSDK
jgi:hypothetical protein